MLTVEKSKMRQGETDLTAMLSGLSPEQHPGDFVFVFLPHQNMAKAAQIPAEGYFREPEGITVICEEQTAVAHELHYDSVFTKITCNVHSSLEAVGLTAAISRVLADHCISANVVAAYFHDHIFVPKAHANHAVVLLESFATP